MTNALERYFTAPGSALRLGVSRALFYGWYFLQARAYDAGSYARLPEEWFSPPLLLFAFGPPDPATAHVTARLLEASLALACVGLATRAATAAAGILGGYVFGVMYGYGFADFHLSPLVLISWVLAFAPCGDAFSADALLRRRPLAADPGDYRWPIRLAQITLVGFMFTGGLGKVFGNWLVQPLTNMKTFLLYKYYSQAGEKGVVLPEWTLDVADQAWLLLPAAVAMVGCEFGSPLALIDGRPRLRLVFIGGLFVMQLSLAVWLRTLPSFPWAAAYVFWVPWERYSRGSGPLKE